MKQEGSYINIAPRPRGQAIYEANCSPVSHGGRTVYYAWGLVTCFKAAPKTGQLGQRLWGVGCFYYSAILPCEKTRSGWRTYRHSPYGAVLQRWAESILYKTAKPRSYPETVFEFAIIGLLKDVIRDLFLPTPLFWCCNRFFVIDFFFFSRLLWIVPEMDQTWAV